MPRQARIDAPGALHHIIIRGMERKTIFKGDKDKAEFIKRLSHLLPDTNTACYAWCLMTNHVHLLLRSGPKGISHLMRRLLTGYAVYFNHRNKRHGHLFQNRYKSILCQEDIYLKELVRYIHLNPIRAKMLTSLSQLDSYPFCGHSALMGEQNFDWQDSDYVNGYFGSNLKQAQQELLSFMKDGLKQGKRPDLIGGGLVRSIGGWAELKKLKSSSEPRVKGDERILGDSTFVESVLKQAKKNLKTSNITYKTLENKILKLYQLNQKDLQLKTRKPIIVEARSLLCYWAVRRLNMICTALAKQLNLTQPAVSYAVTRGEQIAKNKNLDFNTLK